MKKESIIKKIAVFAMLGAVALGSLTGCGNSEQSNTSAADTPINLTVVLDVTKNSPAPDLTFIENDIMQLATYGGHLTVIVDDGSSKDNFQQTDIAPPDKGKTPSAQKKEIQRHASQIGTEIMAMKALTPEKNTISSLYTASNNTVQNGQKNVLVIFDSGIQTVGAGRMTDLRVVNDNSEQLIKNLKENRNIPDMSAFSEIRWYGIGQVAGEQEEPLPKDVEELKAYYTTLFKEGGCTVADNMFDSRTYSPTPADYDRNSFPEVSTVLVSQIPEFKPDEEVVEDNKLKSDVVFKMDEEAIAFQPNTAVLADKAKAEEAVKPIVEKLENTIGNIVLIGTTATYGNADSAVELSRQRAESVKELLVSAGVDKDRILVFGAGYNDKKIGVDDIDVNGNLVEASAKKNRAVWLMSSENDLCQKYLESKN